MRAAVIVALLEGGCLAGSLDANSRPVGMTNMMAIPEDREKRNAILDQQAAEPGPEQHAKLSKKAHKVETAVSFAAAVLGMVYSKHANILLGAATPIDASEIVQGHGVTPPKHPRRKPSDHQVDDTTTPSEDETVETTPVDSKTLVPWVKLTN